MQGRAQIGILSSACSDAVLPSGGAARKWLFSPVTGRFRCS